MLSVLGVDELEKLMSQVAGVKSVTVNYAAGSATVRYDETRLEIADIKSAVRQSGHGATTPAAPMSGPAAGKPEPDQAAPDKASDDTRPTPEAP